MAKLLDRNDPRKVAVVFGGSGGIGTAYVDALITEMNLRVIVADQDRKRGIRVVNTHNRKNPGCCEFKLCNVEDSFEIRNVLRDTTWLFNRLDYIIYTAGVANEENWEKQVQINLEGAIQTLFESRHYLHDNGIIVLTTCLCGIHGDPYYPVNAAVNAGLISLVRSFAIPGANHMVTERVKVFGITAGPTSTDLQRTAYKSNDKKSEHLKDIQWKANAVHKQKPESVAECLVNILRDEDIPSGTIFAVKDDETPVILKYDRMFRILPAPVQIGNK